MESQSAICLETEALCARLRELALRIPQSDAAGLRDTLEGLRGELDRHESAVSAGLEKVWVVTCRDADDAKRVSLVSVERSEDEAKSAIARIHLHERSKGFYYSHVGAKAARVGTNYLYGLDGEPELPFF